MDTIVIIRKDTKANMGSFVDELRDINAPQKVEPIRSRTVIENDVIFYYGWIKSAIRRTKPNNGVIKVNLKFHLFQNYIRYYAGTDANHDDEYNVHGRIEELVEFVSLLKTYCANDGITFFMSQRIGYPSKLKKTLTAVEEILRTANTPDKFSYWSVFSIII